MLTGDLYELPGWATPAFIVAVLAAVAILSVRGHRRPSEQDRSRDQNSPAFLGTRHLDDPRAPVKGSTGKDLPRQSGIPA
jgi:hypothetical protein